MNQSTSDAGKKRVRNILLAAVAAGGLFLGGLFYVSQTEPVPDPGRSEDPISDACWKQLSVQQRLAELGVRAMAAYGRIDPAIYVVAADGSQIRVNPDAKPVESPDSAAALNSFQAALRAVNEEALLRERFIRGHAKAIEACQGHCPPNAYSLQVKEQRFGKNEGHFAWEVLGQVPTDPEWLNGFLNQYGGDPTQTCSFSPALELRREPASGGRPAETALLDAPAAIPPASAGLQEEAAEQTAFMANRPERNYDHGTAATRDPCNSQSHDSCDICRTPTGAWAGYYLANGKWCCGGC
jgi:nitroreductase